MHAAELEAHFAELDGYSAEARAGELLLGVGIPLVATPGADERDSARIQAAHPAGASAICRSRTFCCWMSQPTIWISTLSAGWKM